MKRRSAELSRFWKERRLDRIDQQLPSIEMGIPILLEIDPSANIDFLRGLGFEIICEIEDGFIIVASEDVDFSILNEKVDAFIANLTAKCNSPAKIYALCEDNDRLKEYYHQSFMKSGLLFYQKIFIQLMLVLVVAVILSFLSVLPVRKMKMTNIIQFVNSVG
ncbi:MAG: hypothetical protein ACLR1T_16140 [Evtepia gabavorous]